MPATKGRDTCGARSGHKRLPSATLSRRRPLSHRGTHSPRPSVQAVQVNASRCLVTGDKNAQTLGARERCKLSVVGTPRAACQVKNPPRRQRVMAFFLTSVSCSFGTGGRSSHVTAQHHRSDATHSESTSPRTNGGGKPARSAKTATSRRPLAAAACVPGLRSREMWTLERVTVHLAAARQARSCRARRLCFARVFVNSQLGDSGVPAPDERSGSEVDRKWARPVPFRSTSGPALVRSTSDPLL